MVLQYIEKWGSGGLPPACLGGSGVSPVFGNSMLELGWEVLDPPDYYVQYVLLNILI